MPLEVRQLDNAHGHTWRRFFSHYSVRSLDKFWIRIQTENTDTMVFLALLKYGICFMQDNRSVVSKINMLGSATLVLGLTYSLVSPFLAAAQPPLVVGANQFGTNQPKFFSDLSTSPYIPAALSEALAGHSVFVNGPAFLAAYCIPLLVATACFFAVGVLLVRNRKKLTDAIADRMLLWAMAFAVVAVPAFNVMTQDIWLSVVWGRMIDHAANPFTIPFLTDLASDLPFDYRPVRATYGPLWIGLASCLSWLGFGSPLLTWIFLKLVLLVSWLGCLWLVSDLSRGRDPYFRCRAIAVAGWLPICVHLGVAEGHNDVTMVAFALLWARTMRKAGSGAVLALTASVLVKYVTAPLIIVDLAAHWNGGAFRTRRYLARVAPAALVLVAVFVGIAAFGMFGAETAAMAHWRFFDPAGVLRALEHVAGIDGWVARNRPVVTVVELLPFALFFLVVALIAVEKLVRTRNDDTVARTQLAVMSFVLFVVVGHVWPWYFIWCIPFAALASSYWLSWFMVGAASVAPFTMVCWWHFDLEDPFYAHDLPSLPLYGAAVLAVVVCARWKERVETSRSGSYPATEKWSAVDFR
ncbi:MAG TPA: hypothetical protein VLU73_00040 [Methylococcaceae bacterium]|nr:hypothetical protein [Methylococcaceae bacterium]